jgi:hypothetical protein
MCIGLHRKRFKAALIDRPGSRRVVVRMPALGMGNGHPPQHFRELAILSRPEEEVPVIRHQTIGGNANPRLGLGFGQNLLKRGIVSGLLKQRKATDSAVEYMIGKISSSETRSTRHGNLLPNPRHRVKKRLPTPFLALQQRIEPGCPWQNGRVERFIGTVKRELAREPIADGNELSTTLQEIRTWYNHDRPHDHLQGRTPGEVWAGINVFAAKSG